MNEVSFELSGAIANIVIDRPSTRNALSCAAMEELGRLFTFASEDPRVLVITLTGAGTHAFSSGIDLREASERRASGHKLAHPMTGTLRNIFELILEVSKPTIAAINGAAVGAGCELALACDIRLMADDAIIGLPEAKRGLGANFGSVLLPRLVSRAVALDLLYTGRLISASEARSIGLVSHVFPSDRFRHEIELYASTVAANAPLSLLRFKQMSVKGWDLPVHSALRLDVGPNPYDSLDQQEGAKAFIEKREPVWRGK